MRFPQKPFIIAHRGARSVAPENTLLAFQKAIELGADGIECDVFLSQDGVPVVIHDETLDRTTKGHGLVWDHTAAELDLLGVPTLEQTLECLPNGTIINVELKNLTPASTGQIEALIKPHQNRLSIFLSSFKPELLLGWSSWLPIGLLFEKGQAVEIPGDLSPDALCLNPSLLPGAPAGFRTVLWTAKNLDEARLWLAQGADGVIAEF